MKDALHEHGLPPSHFAAFALSPSRFSASALPSVGPYKVGPAIAAEPQPELSLNLCQNCRGTSARTVAYPLPTQPPRGTHPPYLFIRSRFSLSLWTYPEPVSFL